jgi:FtsP/CotA-like multicopper oxidase with cupredoxin domain
MTYWLTPSRSIGALLALAGFAAVNGLLGLIVTAPASPAVAAPPPHQHAVPARAPGALREFTIETKEASWEIFPGAAVKAWTYNGQVPGPEIRVTEGDLVRVTLKNSLPEPTTIHWHGVDVPNNMDGIPGITQDAVPPGGTFTYEFVATNPGTRWYHSHQDSEIQLPLGLYGPMIVEPAAPVAGEPVYDREYTYVLSEWSLALTPDVATGNATLPRSGPGAPHSKQLDYDFFLMNGHAHESIEPVMLSKGERVRIRLINAGSLVHTVHTHGHSFKIVATDGNPVPAVAQLTKDSVTLGPSERVDIELLATNPGVWVFHCHMEHHMANGMMTTIQYEGVQPVVQGGGGHGAHSSPPPASAASAPSLASTTALPEAAAVPQNATKVSMVDNRFQPASLTVRAGTTVAWINNGANVHTVSGRDGSVDSGAILPGKAFLHAFSTPGTYQFICRQHLLNGMSTTVTVQ